MSQKERDGDEWDDDDVFPTQEVEFLDFIPEPHHVLDRFDQLLEQEPRVSSTSPEVTFLMINCRFDATSLPSLSETNDQSEEGERDNDFDDFQILIKFPTPQIVHLYSIYIPVHLRQQGLCKTILQRLEEFSLRQHRVVMIGPVIEPILHDMLLKRQYQVADPFTWYFVHPLLRKKCQVTITFE